MGTACARRPSPLLLGCTLLAAAALPALAQAWQPEKNVEIIVAGGPGGGTDQLARLIQSIITTHKLLDVNTIVLNKGGGNGAEAFLDLKMNKGDAEKLVIATNNVYLLPLVSKLGYQWQELTPVAALAEDDFILWSYKGAPWPDAKGLYDAVKADPGKLRMGGSQSKDVDQTLTLLLNQTNTIDLSSLHQQNAVKPRVAEHLCRLLRLAILFASRRRDDLLPAIPLTVAGEKLVLTLPEGWLEDHPLGRELVEQECQWQSYVHWTLEVA